MSVHSDTPRSPEFATPKCIPDYSENSSVALSLSPRSRTSSQIPTSLPSDIHEPSASSSTASNQRTPLPSKKEASSMGDLFESKQEMEQVTQRTPMVQSPRQGELAESSREQSSDIPAETSLKRKSLDSRPVSQELISANSPQMRSLSIGEHHSRYKSPSAAPSFDIVGTAAPFRHGARSPSFTALIADDPGTPPRKRPTLDNERMLVSASQEVPAGIYATFPSISAVSEIVDRSKEASTRIMKRRGRKFSSSDTSERRQLNDSTSDASRSDQNSLSNHPKQDNVTDEGPRHLQPFDHTPRVNFQNPDPSQPQPHAETPLTNQRNIPSTRHLTLPPRPSITPPPGTSPQLTQKYRPPAVVFTIDNRAESRMLTTDVQSFIEQFTKNARVIPPATQLYTSQCVYPIGVIMWQSLPDFYKWYMETTGSTEIGPLRFELIDVKWQTERVLIVPEGDVSYFRTLKQYVWDLFWVASNLNGGPSLFQVSISPYQPRDAAVSSQPSVWNSVNSTHPLPRASSATSLGKSMVVAESRTLPGAATSSPQPAGHSLPLSTLTYKTSNIEDILNTKEVKEVKNRAGRRPTAISSSQPAGKRSVEPGTDSNRIPRPSDYIHGPPGPPVNMSRTSYDKATLRDRAEAFLRGRNDVELLNEESTVHDKLPYKGGAEVCGAIVDRNSGKGLVTVTGKGFITQNVITGLDQTGDRYQEIHIQAKQTCMLHGDAVVLYYKRRTHTSPQPALQPSPKPPILPATNTTTSTTSSTSAIEIIVRLQIDGTGKFSAPFGKSVLRPKVNTTEFFSWFSTQTRRGGPHGPPCLKFTFKDAMPEPKATEVSRGNEDHFNYMRKDVKAQCEKAKAYMPDLKEFVILVTVPGWFTPKGEEEEDW
ncbi:hypothetical protein N431DRAFT_415338 [Stipitochalara longipes BDJ]|nr:hypothetical protein N431DRAFT_415338 [Stipitochalara longipes BDJ]